jgi:hypothetical protein
MPRSIDLIEQLERFLLHCSFRLCECARVRGPATELVLGRDLYTGKAFPKFCVAHSGGSSVFL